MKVKLNARPLEIPRRRWHACDQEAVAANGKLRSLP
jgi:hypothetical protein